MVSCLINLKGFGRINRCLIKYFLEFSCGKTTKKTVAIVSLPVEIQTKRLSNKSLRVLPLKQVVLILKNR
jgi:hypothetical protein